MKKTYKILLLVVAVLFCLTGCGTKDVKQGSAPKKLKIVTTIFPEYDWIKNIMGDKFKDAEVTLLLEQGADIHSYQPSVKDMMQVANCDLFIYVGGESDFWVAKALKEKQNKHRQVVNLMDILGQKVKTEEVVEGMQTEQEEKHEHEKVADKDGHKHEKAPEHDEHVWLSLANAKIICQSLAKTLGQVDSAHAQTYEKNAANYTAQLTSLDAKYKNMVKSSSKKVVLFGDRFPFRYLMDDYGLKYYAAFVGCSAETEASFKTVSFLAQKVDELGLKSIFTLEKSDQKIAKTIAASTKKKDQKILILDSMQAIGTKEIAAGATYLGIMEENLKVLQEALK